MGAGWGGQGGAGNETKNLTHALSHMLGVKSSISLFQVLLSSLPSWSMPSAAKFTLQLKLARTNGEGRQARRFGHKQRQAGHVLGSARGRRSDSRRPANQELRICQESQNPWPSRAF